MAIPQNADRSPQWPAGTLGSISHNDEFAMVAVTRSAKIAGIGVDLEAERSVGDELRTIIRTDYREHDLDLTTLCSAKESVSKAVDSSFGEFLEHADVTIIATQDAVAFSVVGSADTRSSLAMRKGVGQITSRFGLTTTAYWTLANGPRQSTNRHKGEC